MKTCRFYFLSIILILSTIALNSCSNDDSEKNNEIQPEPAQPEIEHTLDFSYKKMLIGKDIRKLIKTDDNSYIGILFSTDYVVAKFDLDFNIIWEKSYGGSKNDYANNIIEDSNGDYIILGYSESTDGDVTKNYGDYDIWLCKIDKNGNLLWEKSYGGSKEEYFGGDNNLIKTPDNGFMFMASSKSDDYDFTNNLGGYDAWIIKINKDGVIENKVNIGGKSDEYGRQLIPLKNNFIVSVGDVEKNSKTYTLIMQVNDKGDIIWKKQLNDINPGTITSTQTGDILVVNNSSQNFIFYKLDSSGNIKLNKTISFYDKYPKQPFTNSIIESKDNGIIITATLGAGNNADSMIFRTNSDFTSVKPKFIIGNDLDMSGSILPLENNNYIVPINTQSTDLLLENVTGMNLSSMIISIKEI